MKTSNKLWIYLILLALIDTIVPIPITAVILMYVISDKPEWFKNLVARVYNAN